MTSISNELDIDAGIEWLTTNTSFPTFDEFRKDPDKWRTRKDDLLISVDRSTQTFKKALTKQKYMWKDVFEVDSLEKIERIACDEGFSVDQLEMQPFVRSTTGMSGESVEVLVRFWPKEEFKAQGGVVANDQSAL